LKDNFKLLLDYRDSPFKLGIVVDMPLYEYELENGQTSDQLPSLQEISEKTDFRFQYSDDHQAGVDQ